MITENYASHTKDELLAEIKARKLTGVSAANSKAELVSALESDDAQSSPEQPAPPLPPLKASNIPVVEPEPVDSKTQDPCAIPDDDQFVDGIYYQGKEPFAVCVHSEDAYGNTHTAKNTLHYWQGTLAAFNATFSHKPS